MATSSISTIQASRVSSQAHGENILSGVFFLAGRILFSLIFLLSAPHHFSQQVIAYAGSQGVPLANIAVPASGVIALLGGLSILLGYRTKIGAWLLILFLIPVTLTLHAFWAVKDPLAAQTQMVMFMKNVSMLGGALMLTYFGSGPFSLDRRRGN